VSAIIPKRTSGVSGPSPFTGPDSAAPLLAGSVADCFFSSVQAGNSAAAEMPAPVPTMNLRRLSALSARSVWSESFGIGRFMTTLPLALELSAGARRGALQEHCQRRQRAYMRRKVALFSASQRRRNKAEAAAISARYSAARRPTKLFARHDGSVARARAAQGAVRCSPMSAQPSPSAH
jgi:hypothetical protein